MRALITGAGGFVGRWIVQHRDPDVELNVVYRSRVPEDAARGVARHFADVGDSSSVDRVVDLVKPDVVVHAAAVASVAECDCDPILAKKINVDGTANLARAAERVGAYIVYLSTDMVFDGTSAPYGECDEPEPLSDYGRTKAEGENYVGGNGLVLRLGLGYGRSLDPTRPNFFEKALTDLAAGRQVKFFSDEWRTPVWVEDTARAIWAILAKKPTGVMHLGGSERMTRAEMAKRACAALGLSDAGVEVVSRLSMTDQKRPEDLTLDSMKFLETFGDFRITRFEEAVIKSFK